MEYLWREGLTHPRFPRLNGDAETDVLVIGGGMAGVLCAWCLHEAGAGYMLVEADRIGGGATLGTTAVLTAQHDTLYQDMIKKHGAETARLYLEANLEALSRIRDMCEKIPCDYVTTPSVMYSADDPGLMRREAEAVRSLGFPARFVKDAGLPFPAAGAVVYDGMAQFHPLKFLYGTAAGLNIREETIVRRIDSDYAVTDRGRIKAKKIIVASHFPFINSRGLYFMKLYQKRSFVIALEGAAQLQCTAMDAADCGIYLRNYGGLLLIGGGDRRTGTGCGFDVPREFARKYFPGAREKFAWAAQDCVSLDGLPYIGRYSPAAPDIFAASGFCLWGMSTSMAAAGILCDMTLGRKNRFSAVFDPSRSMLGSQLLKNCGVTFSDFLFPTRRRCPHLGAALRYNPAERTWDCPCHGSRFEENGKLIDGPSTKNCDAG